MMHLSQLLEKLPKNQVYETFYCNGSFIDPLISSIEVDSRAVNTHSIFFARLGEKVDGHDYIDDAIRLGASVVVYENDNALRERMGVVFIHVQSSHLALAHFSHAFYDFPSQSLTMIGITGTNGKTTCATLMKQLLEAQGLKVGMIGTTGNYIGQDYYPSSFTTPEAPQLAELLCRMKDQNISHVVMEVSSHALALRRVEGISFKVALFTNLTQDHLDFHDSMDDYLLAKKILFDGLTTDAIAVAHADDNATPRMLQSTAARRVLVGRNTTSNYVIQRETLGYDYTTFELNELAVSCVLIGQFNVDNAALCLAASIELGFSKELLLKALSKAHAAPGRMQRVSLSQDRSAIVDYAHTPDALEKALRTTRQIMRTNAKLICVFGCGGDRDKAKRPLMGRIASSLADIVIITNDNPRSEAPLQIIDDIKNGIQETSSVLCIPDRRIAIQKAVSLSATGDVVLLAGKGHEQTQIIGTVRHHFDDVEELHRASAWSE